MKDINNKKIHELIHINLKDIKGESPLDIWFKNLCSKAFNQLDCYDVTTMFNQNIGIEVAALRAFSLLADDPICGLYDWQMLELIVENKEIIKDKLNPLFE